jgi:tRNA pseudouridine38-40 synthase
MPRYFIEVSYKGTNYSGFQLQKNANTIQAEIEKAFEILQKEKVIMTGSSRTDAGVHALQNFLHFDFERNINPHFIYKMNAILPNDIVIKDLKKVSANAHCRFDAISREYYYYVYRYKDPFRNDRAFFFPYKLDTEKMQQAASIVKEHNDFTSFSKRKTQVKNFICNVEISKWIFEKDYLIYNIKANRFLRGMVRGLTATMLKIGRDKLLLDDFNKIIIARDCTQASFAVPAHGLFLFSVKFPDKYFL